jgi:hypothetical protein
MNVGSAIKRFERRGGYLVGQAWMFLLAALGLMAFGGYVVFSASSLTARDIGGQDFDKRFEAAQAEVERLGKRAVGCRSRFDRRKSSVWQSVSRPFHPLAN